MVARFDSEGHLAAIGCRNGDRFIYDSNERICALIQTRLSRRSAASVRIQWPPSGGDPRETLPSKLWSPAIARVLSSTGTSQHSRSYSLSGNNRILSTPLTSIEVEDSLPLRARTATSESMTKRPSQWQPLSKKQTGTMLAMITEFLL